MTISNSTIANNYAKVSGGGISSNNGNVFINLSTISENSAPTGGGIKHLGGAVQIQNTILGGNNTTQTGPDCSGTIISNGHNLIEDLSGCSVTLNINDLNTNPQLGVFIDSQGYFPLASTSPAIDAGDTTCNGTTDRRDLARPQGVTCDIGSYEYTSDIGNAAKHVLVSGNNQYVFINQTFPLELKTAVLDDKGSPIAGVQVTFTAPANGASGIFEGTNDISDTAITDLYGVATTPPLIANNKFGAFNVIARVEGGIPDVTFSLLNGGWFVTPDGNDLNDCRTPVTACATINAAIAKAPSAETVHVREGTYGGGSDWVVKIQKDIKLSGGWDTNFTIQGGYSILDGNHDKGGLYLEYGYTATIDNFTVQYAYGNAIENQGQLTLNNNLVTDNSGSNGSGVYNVGTLTINRSVITRNLATNNAGGIYNFHILTLNDSRVEHNISINTDLHSHPSGGGIVNDTYATMTILSSHIAYNQADYGGGISNSGSITIENSSIYNNTAILNGGAIRNQGTAVLKNVTVSENTANNGGGIYSDASLTLNNSTVAYNTANTHGGGIVGSITMQNTILANNIAGVTGKNCYNTITSLGFNVVSSEEGCTITQKSGDKFNTDPKIGLFLEAKGYYPLYSNSPAIDAGNPSSCTPSDQRGSPRIDGDFNESVICDIGAYEYAIPGAASQIIVAGGANQHTAPGTEFILPLQVAILDSQGTPVQGVKVEFIAPNIGPSGVFSNGTVGISKFTNSSGVANVGTMTANLEYGQFAVQATTPDLAQVVTLNLKNSIWFVASNGNNANNCDTPMSPCAGIEGVISRIDFASGDLLRVAVGTYNRGNLALPKDIIIQGGWDSSFTHQIGASIIEDAIKIPTHVSASIKNLTIQNTGLYGIYNYGTLHLEQSTIRANKAGLINAGNGVVTNTTISQNNSIGYYPEIGGVSNGGGTLLIINSTITGNVASNHSGISQDSGANGNISISNSIVSGNIVTNSANAGPDCKGPVTSLGYNLIGNIGNMYIGSCITGWASTDLVGYYYTDPIGNNFEDRTINAQLGPISDMGNGVWIHPLLVNSPALNTASPITPGTADDHACFTTDQRGVTRPQGSRCDIGAYELTTFQSSPVRISTYDAANTWVLPGTLICQSSDANCSTSIPGAWAAHKFAHGTYDFFRTRHDRNSIDDHGMEIISTVQYGTDYDNAFWNHQQMVYGDAHAFSNADDVVAHELTHGVTDFESGLFYYYQSGAINESFSDLWGEAYDQIGNITASDTESVKWLLGEDVTGVGASRNMSNPPQFDDPDHMTSPLYKTTPGDNGGVHSNSGINNKAVALMVNGGTFNGRIITALGWSKVLTVYYEVQTHLLTSGSDYLDLYNALYQGCLNKVGTSDIVAADCQEVFDAAHAVEMHLEPTTGFNPNAAECPASKPFAAAIFLDDFETGVDGWSFPVSTGQNGWQLAAGYAASGNHMLWADDVFPLSISSAQIGFWVPNGTNSYLRFSHSYGFEYAYGAGQYRYYDGGIFEYSTDQGITWKDTSSLFDAGKTYSGNIFDPGDVYWANPLKGKNAFVGESHGYVDSRYNLTTLAGKHVLLRWSLGTDDVNYLTGWTVDNIQVSACGSLPDTFFDVPKYHWAWKYIESIYNASITGGCTTSPLMYCPSNTVTRAQMAIFLERGMNGSSFIPPDATGSVFGDIPANHWAAKWIEQLAVDGVTGGCNDENYCPDYPVTRDQMAVFLLRAKHGPTYVPPAVDGNTGFADVPVDYWAAAWIKQLALEGITGGCSNGNYCPDTPVTRDQMAVFLQRTFGLPLP